MATPAIQYKDFAPTGFDPKGAFVHDERADWWVRAGRNRDSSSHRFNQTLRRLGGPSDTSVEVLRFRHWACGWYEIILTKRAPRARKGTVSA